MFTLIAVKLGIGVGDTGLISNHCKNKLLKPYDRFACAVIFSVHFLRFFNSIAQASYAWDKTARATRQHEAG